MYRKLPNLVLGFHGCNLETFEKVIYKQEQLKRSSNVYDWLGNGIYFWEHNLERARQWAENRYKEDGRVIGAVIDLGYCLNLMDSSASELLRSGYELLKARYDLLEIELPHNRKSRKTEDVLLRDLDCAVIQQIHDFKKDSEGRDYDSVRGAFIEGGPAFPGAEFREKTHIQICICNPNCIKGYFNPLAPNNNYPLP